uniref:BACK domain-containing protein n=1 Tax=Panagrolaimus sp. ES5 TaxID=591445 RepID=A0AC34FAH4_9BILA
MLELAYKYSLECLKESLFEFISTNLLSFAKTEQLISLPHSIIYDIVESSQNTVRQEELFEMVYIWAENKATEKQKSDPNLNINEAIKEELSDILQFFKFKMINHGFVMKFVVSKSFLFSGAELCDILSESRRVVTFIDENGKMAKGVLDCDDNEKMFHIIQSKKNLKGPVWKVEEPLPSSKLIENDSIDWYLTYYKCDEDCYFMVKNRSVINHCDVSLLAELIAEDEFQHENCKIV